MKMKGKLDVVLSLGLLVAGHLGLAQTNAPTPAAPTVAAKTGGAPKIKFEQLVYDFGTISAVPTVAGTFTFENAGSGELEITKVAPSCGCTATTVKPASKKLPPGEKGEISFTVNTGSGRGRMEKHIAVTSNDPQTPAINLAIRLEVVPVLDVPVQLSFGELALGQTTNIVLQVKRTNGQPFQLAKVESSDPALVVRVEPAESTTNTVANVVLTVTASGAARQFHAHVPFFLAGTPLAVASLSVSGRIVGDLRVTPQQVYWGIGDPKSWSSGREDVMNTRTVRIALTKPGPPLVISNLVSSLPSVALALVTEETGKVYRVVVKLKELPTAPQTGSFSFATNLPNQSTVIVPVYVFVGGSNFGPRINTPPVVPARDERLPLASPTDLK